jgi:diguanylate cyclase (GGDEF)-like protein
MPIGHQGEALASRIAERWLIVRSITRTDASLAVSLVVATITLFSQPLKQLLDAIAAVEDQYHLAFLPALTVLAVAFAITQSQKRIRSAADARLSQTRAAELERLLTFGTALAGALDEEALQRTLCQQLPAFLDERGYWLLARRDTDWIEVAQAWPHGIQRSIESQEGLAEEAQRLATTAGTDRLDADFGDVVCFPLTVGSRVIGVLGVQNSPPLSRTDRTAFMAMLVPLGLALRNVDVLRDLQQQGMVDPLTGCLNRATGVLNLQQELRRARRSRQPLSVLMIDIDHFKTVNDTWGHLAGNVVLEAFGARIAQVLRTTDIRCRFGGDEFLVVLPDTPAVGAERAAVKLQEAMRVLDTGIDAGRTRMTLSIGIAQAERGEVDVASLIGRADEAMYVAKRAGRGTFRVAGVQPSAPGGPTRRLLDGGQGAPGSIARVS